MAVQDDGTVTFIKDRLEISLRPMTDEELNRQFPDFTGDGVEAENPYTHNGWVNPETGQTPTRFTVFLLGVKNYAYPKVLVDPATIRLTSTSGREYKPFTSIELDDYYLAYATGYAGNKYKLYNARRDILRQTMYQRDLVFSGQEQSGYIVLPRLHHDVSSIRILIEDVGLRFDYLNEPTEFADIEYAFHREIGRDYPRREGPERRETLNYIQAVD